MRVALHRTLATTMGLVLAGLTLALADTLVFRRPLGFVGGMALGQTPTVACGSAQALTWNGAAWGCLEVPAASVTPLACPAGRASSWSGSAWSCVAIPGAISAEIVSPLPCTAGQASSWSGTGWGCVAVPAAMSAHWAAAPGGIAYMGGQVGIGLTSPTQDLHVRGPAGPNADLRLDNGDPAKFMDVFSGSSDAGLSVYGGLPLHLRTGTNATRLTIDGTSGNVGIGASPGVPRLTVQGGLVNLGPTGDNALINRNTDTSNTYFRAQNANGTADFGVGSAGLFIAAGGSQGLSLFTGATARLAIDGSGQVGIGGAPVSGSRLAVSAEAGTETIARFETAHTNAGIELRGGNLHQFLRFFRSGAGQWELGSSPSGDFYLNTTPGQGTNGADVFVSDSGSVGINTTYLRQELTGGGTGVDNGDVSLFAESTRTTKWVDVFGGTTDGGLAAYGGLDLRLHAANGTRLFVSGSTGHVGVQRSDPAFPLDVAGQIRATGNLTTSDLRLKTEIGPLGERWRGLLALAPVTYRWIAPPSEAEAGPRLGLIAQDVRRVFPELVSQDMSGTLAVDHAGLIAPLVGAAAAHEARLAALAQENAALRDDVRDLAARLSTLEAKRHASLTTQP